jgi:hypothetical protein
MRQIEDQAVPTATGSAASTRGALHDWPMAMPPTGHRRRPWSFAAKGYLEVLFKDGDEARRARRDLQEHGVPAADMRLYVAEEVLSSEAGFLAGRSWLAKVVDAVTADDEARRRDLANARAGGAVLWLYAPTRHDANRLLRVLADHHVSYIRHDSNEDGVRELTFDAS